MNASMTELVEKVPREYVVKKMSENMMKMTIKEKKKRKIITIINVYAPTTSRARKFPHELIKLYNQLEQLCKELKWSTTTTIIAGDFNAKVGTKQSQNEQCIGRWSRGRRNESGSKLVDFCERGKKTISNTCFQHPAKYMTTWSQKRMNSEATGYDVIYNQIDYIIIDTAHKHTLTGARSYSGTETFSDHRLVIARMKVHWATLFKSTPRHTHTQTINVKELCVNHECRAPTDGIRRRR